MKYRTQMNIAALANKIVICLQSKLLSGGVVVGDLAKLSAFKTQLITQLNDENVISTWLDLTDLQSFKLTASEASSTLLIIWGLESLTAEHKLTFALRSILDEQRHQGVRYLLFCDEKMYSKHFQQYSAPFYQFCFPIWLSDIEF